ncbi:MULTISPECIES: DUF4367 domain-containing protein [Brevibacillus]|uniref:DUF4367 domain-containing protein n=1 Tax=Brevibacillus porteri TaxID=2126350 RepID=A0ABX5FFL3_9BACL|nr:MULTISPECIES: DUF4367 domain-containing protein [Brevibacillus]MED2133304.1 DUF4367 domain-containing protein [Brevibacillus porteri]MED2748765.1 DUF4367 domain-containing protein [Brevibacillus porteri]MED2812533.1 DUF4367 domain-containing protein [Brevibacillus porteri]MED2895572.1 DUF4367 domain-containing protein [Brevibacillus porteri]MED4898240.1 DUF4367 domain-containing protein [Brevibacillus porteri]
MRIFPGFFLSLCVVLSPITTVVHAVTFQYGPHNTITIETLQKEIDFKLLVPTKIPKDWILEIKEGPRTDGKQDYCNLNFLDKNDQYLMMSLNQKKAIFKELDSYQNRRDNTEIVQINNFEGHFEAWVGGRNGANDTPGGYLRWIQKGTYVEMESSRLSKEEMIKIAKSLK